MNSTKSILVSFVVVVIIFTIGLVSFGIANYRISKELDVNKESLKSTQELLNKTQTDLIAENEKSAELSEQLNTANTVIESLKSEEYVVGTTVTNMEIDMLAKTVWGEARGCSKIEQSAVVWCILNRVDAGWGTIAEVIAAPNQFHGYNTNFPVTDEIKVLVEDVVTRWKLEKTICGDVGRTLPEEYLFFVADGTGIGNVFYTNWNSPGEKWDWDCWNPYS